MYLVIAIDLGYLINAGAVCGLSFLCHIGLRDSVGLRQDQSSAIACACAIAIWCWLRLTPQGENDYADAGDS